MAVLRFAEIKVMKFMPTDKEGQEIPNAEPVVIDQVHLQIAKSVTTSTMLGEKGEFYKVPVSDIPFVFQSEVKFPAFAGFDGTARETAVREFLKKYIGSRCIAEDIAKGDKRILTSIEFLK